MSDKNSNNALYLIVGALIFGVLVLGYVVYSGQADEPDLAIEVSEDGIDVDTD